MEQSDATEKWNDIFQKQKSQSKNDNKELFPNKITSYIFIYDCGENNILYVNNSFEILTGHKTNAFNLDFLISIIHPDDLAYFFKCEERGLEFTNKLSFNEHFRYTLSYTYRIKNSKGDYIKIQQECQAIEVNTSGHLTKTFVTHKLLNKDSNDDSSKDYKIFDKLRGFFIDEENSYNLSKRELEILTLIKAGYNSAEVAHQLNISKNTILTHRKNILAKTNSNSFIELLKKLSYSEY